MNAARCSSSKAVGTSRGNGRALGQSHSPWTPWNAGIVKWVCETHKISSVITLKKGFRSTDRASLTIILLHTSPYLQVAKGFLFPMPLIYLLPQEINSFIKKKSHKHSIEYRSYIYIYIQLSLCTLSAQEFLLPFNALCSWHILSMDSTVIVSLYSYLVITTELAFPGVLTWYLLLFSSFFLSNRFFGVVFLFSLMCQVALPHRSQSMHNKRQEEL